jgi:hypothetical protein
MADYSAGATAPKSVGRDTLGTALKDFDDVQKRLISLLGRTTSLADMLGGPVPRDASARPDEPPAGSVVQRLHRQRRDMAALLGQLDDELSRAESMVQG